LSRPNVGHDEVYSAVASVALQAFRGHTGRKKCILSLLLETRTCGMAKLGTSQVTVRSNRSEIGPAPEDRGGQERARRIEDGFHFDVFVNVVSAGAFRTQEKRRYAELALVYERIARPFAGGHRHPSPKRRAGGA